MFIVLLIDVIDCVLGLYLKGDGPASEVLLMKICMVHLAGSMVNLHSRRIKFTGKICVISILLLWKFYSIVDYMSLNYLVQ